MPESPVKIENAPLPHIIGYVRNVLRFFSSADTIRHMLKKKSKSYRELTKILRWKEWLLLASDYVSVAF